MKDLNDFTNEQITFWVESYIHNARDRDLIKRKLCDGVVFEILAEEFDLSVRQTKYIVGRAKERLLTYYKA